MGANLFACRAGGASCQRQATASQRTGRLLPGGAGDMIYGDMIYLEVTRMPSPFPGMDPFIEGDSWQDFHLRFIGVVTELLTPCLRPHYLVRAEERVYLEHPSENGRLQTFGPDISVVTESGLRKSSTSGGGTAMAVAAAPTIVRLPMPVREREHYLTILWRETMEVVTIVEILSPSNKRRGSEGRREYLSKRETALLSGSHLVEIDLLRAGERLPVLGPPSPGHYYAIVSRAERRPNAEEYGWLLLHRMPVIPIPLRGDDPDVALDLQVVLNTVYDRSDYDYSLDYDRPLDPTPDDAAAAAISEALRARRGETAAASRGLA